MRYSFLILFHVFFIQVSSAQKYNELYYSTKHVKQEDGKTQIQVGFVNAAGKTMIDFKYDPSGNYSKFVDGLAIVTKNWKKGCIDTTGKVVVPFIYNDLYRLPTKDILYEGKTTNDSLRIFEPGERFTIMD